jgi:hypothetical protein
MSQSSSAYVPFSDAECIRQYVLVPNRWVDRLLGRDDATLARQERTARHPIATGLSLGLVIAALFGVAWGRSYGAPGVIVAIAMGTLAAPVAVLEAKRRVRRRGRD